MGANRLFWPQDLLDEWVVEEKIAIDGDVLVLKDDASRYRIRQAVHFLSDVGDGADAAGLLGKVKEIETLTAMGAEHYMDSVLMGDSAYKVAPGFTGEPLAEEAGDERDLADDISGAIATQTGGAGETDDRELLARFLLENL